MGSMVIIIMILICCCIILAGGGTSYWYFMYGPGATSNAASTTSNATPTDSRSTVWSTGQQLQSAPFEVGTLTAPIAMTKPPTGYSSQTSPSFTISFDVNIAKSSTIFRNIMAHGSGCCGGVMRKPSVYLTPTNPPNLHVAMNLSANGDNTSMVTATPFVLGTWYNVVIVVDSGKLTAYMNGIADKNTVSGAFVWATPDQSWTWGDVGVLSSQDGSVQVANVYFWPSALTSTQISSLNIPKTPDSNVATTSYFTPEPFSMMY